MSKGSLGLHLFIVVSSAKIKRLIVVDITKI